LLVGAPAFAGRRYSTVAVSGVIVSAVLLILVALPFASSLPDGYEAAASSSGWRVLLAEDAASLSGLNLTAWRVQQRVVSAIESLLGDGQLLALAASALTGIASLAIAAALAGRQRAAGLGGTP
jgi:hypothetical protein